MSRLRMVAAACAVAGLWAMLPSARGDHVPCRHSDSVAGQVFPVEECELRVVRQTLEVVFEEHPEQTKLEGQKHWSEYAHCFGLGGRRMFSAPRATVTAIYDMLNPAPQRIEREMAFPFTGQLSVVREGHHPAQRFSDGDAWMALGYEVTCDATSIPVTVAKLESPASGQPGSLDGEGATSRLAAAMASQWGYDGQFLDPDTGRLYPRGSFLPDWQRYQPNWVKAPLAWSAEARTLPMKAPHGLGFLRYRLAFGPGQERKVSVRYRTLTDYDTGIDQLCCRPMIAQFGYLLHPVRYWSHFGPIEVRLVAPACFRLAVNLGPWTVKEAQDRVTYACTLKRPESNLHVALYRGTSPLADFLLYSLLGGCPPTRGEDAQREGWAAVERIYGRLAEDDSERLSVREAALRQLTDSRTAGGGSAERRRRLADLLEQVQARRQAESHGPR